MSLFEQVLLLLAVAALAAPMAGNRVNTAQFGFQPQWTGLRTTQLSSIDFKCLSNTAASRSLTPTLPLVKI